MYTITINIWWKENSCKAYHIKVLLSTDVHGIKTEYRAWKGRKGNIKLQFKIPWGTWINHLSGNWSISNNPNKIGKNYWINAISWIRCFTSDKNCLNRKENRVGVVTMESEALENNKEPLVLFFYRNDNRFEPWVGESGAIQNSWFML